MRLYYIWWRGSKRAKIWSREGCSWEVMKVKGSNRRCSFRSVMATVLIMGVILPFVLISAAFLALEGASKCSSSAVFSSNVSLFTFLPFSCLFFSFHPSTITSFLAFFWSDVILLTLCCRLPGVEIWPRVFEGE